MDSNYHLLTTCTSVSPWRSETVQKYLKLVETLPKARAWILQVLDHPENLEASFSSPKKREFILQMQNIIKDHGLNLEVMIDFLRSVLSISPPCTSAIVPETYSTPRRGKNQRQCPICKVFLHPKSLARHKRLIHSSKKPVNPMFATPMATQVIASTVEDPTIASPSFQLPTIANVVQVAQDPEYVPSSSSEDTEDETKVEEGYQPTRKRQIIAMKECDDSELVKYKQQIQSICERDASCTPESLNVNVRGIYLTLKRLIPIARKYLKTSSSIEVCLIGSCCQEVVDSYLEALLFYTKNASTRRNEAKRLKFIFKHFVLYKSFCFESHTVENVRRILEYLTSLEKFASKKIKLPTVEELQKGNEWSSLENLRAKLMAFYRSELEPHMNEEPSPALSMKFQAFCFLSLLLMNRPMRTNFYETLALENIVYQGDDIVLRTKDFKTSKTFGVLCLNLCNESCKTLKLWLEKFRPYLSFSATSNRVFGSKTKYLTHIVFGNALSTQRVRHIYRTDLSHQLLTNHDPGSVEMMDSADAHSTTTAQRHYVYVSEPYRMELSKQADDMYRKLFPIEEPLK